MIRYFYKILQQLYLLRLKKSGVLIGKDTFISRKAYIDRHKGSKVTIGANCYITRNVVILNHTDTCRGGPKGIWMKYGADRISEDVTIGDNVFIGVNSVILPGITIGDNAVIGALSLVNKDIPANTVWGGIPAKYITETHTMIQEKFSNFNPK